MSIKTWIKEYMPHGVKTPSTMDRDTRYDTGLAYEMVEWSLLKWTGVSPKNLSKHGLVMVKFCGQYHIKELATRFSQKLSLNSDTCVLCSCYSCCTCPLARFARECDDLAAPYHVFNETGDAEVMVDALHGCMVWLEKMAKEGHSDILGLPQRV